ncbi:MAG: NUDIX domain-containing protein [Fusicatenibacter sp.]|nr:NUDIX domain-containing protein [Lachnospiraceae bacterium]MDY2937463.1 NUDIX domain-containing protein [Fusicatenibacter sp.]
MEQWDIYDGERKKTGRFAVRGNPLGVNEFHLVSDVWTVKDDGRILITQRHPKKVYGMLWECTGGSVLKDETSRAGAVREVREETGLQCREDELIPIHTIRLQDRFVDTYLLQKKVQLSELVLQKEEVVRARLVTFDELMDLWEIGQIVPRKRFGMYYETIQNFVRKLEEG